MAARPYQPPLDSIRFTLRSLAGLDEILRLPGYQDFTPDLTDAILEEAAKFATEVLSPLNASGDREGCKHHPDGNVTSPAGFKAAYKAFVDNGWNAAPIAAELGGQGLPQLLSTAIAEIWHGANMAFGLCPMLTQSAIELISKHASPALQAQYLPKLVSGEWTGTMCMTEPQAGSDVGAVRAQAVPGEDGAYQVSGTKIFITWGEHDLTDNIIHMVLARLPDAPSGTRGLSLFLVPKFLPGGARNDVSCVSLEHKMGIHASPTCVMSFGEKGGATGWLVGEKHGGIQAMFTMMNAARFAVGMEGIGIASYANFLAQAYANERMQGKDLNGHSATIRAHADVARMLGSLAAHSEAMRALAYDTAAHMDRARRHPEERVRQVSAARVDLLIPVIKSYGTQLGFDMASLAMQVHGGMGYIEETGVSQLLRDVRVAMIYEGTNGIQALDLVGRKLNLQGGAVLRDYLSEIWTFSIGLEAHSNPEIAKIGKALAAAHADLDKATIWMHQHYETARDFSEALHQIHEGAQDYLSLFGLVCEAYMLAKMVARQHALAPAGNALKDKLHLADFFMRRILPDTRALSYKIIQ